jgi:hypothetical protein
MERGSMNGNTPDGTRQWNYCAAMQFFARVINVALIDCKCALAIAPVAHAALVALPLPGADPAGRPTDDALLARDWIARSESPADGRVRRYLSFPECCGQIGVDVEASRTALLAAIDAAGDYDNDEAWARLEELSARELPDDVEPLFDAPRVVPALDQIALF